MRIPKIQGSLKMEGGLDHKDHCVHSTNNPRMHQTGADADSFHMETL